tara:strand:+ start:373 stop:846 length:474 start_codon:yes stop_codon:yes gene_type:complete
MVNYGNGKIYKLVNNVDDKIYVGSTCSTLSKRKGNHKSSAKHKDYTVYRHLNEVGWENVNIVLIEECECKNKDELHKRERYFIDELKPDLNINLPNRKYVGQFNLDYKKAWREKNKAEINQKAKQNKHICECGTTVQNSGKARHKKTKKHISYINSQ